MYLGGSPLPFPEVQKQYVTHEELGGEQAKKVGAAAWRERSRWLAKRKMGITCDEKVAPQRKRRRVKTYQAVISVSNMIEQMCGVDLGHFFVPMTPDGKLTSPFTWPHLNLACDQGADMMALDHYLGYGRRCNVHCDWDPTQGAHNGAFKDSLKEVGLWRHMLGMMSAMNTAYVSTMPPPRMQQVRDAVEEYMRSADPLTDGWFQVWLPHILRQMGSDTHIADEHAAIEVWFKSAKCNLAKYMLCIRRSREVRQYHAIKALLYTYACFQLRYREPKQVGAQLSSSAAGSSASASAGASRAPHEGASLKQVAKATEEQTWKGENQLHTADMVYSDVTSFYKQNIIVNALAPTEAWSGHQNASLKEASASVEWETQQLKGALHEHMADTVRGILRTEGYEDMGIETAWSEIQELSLVNPRVCSSNDHCALLWDLVFSLVRHRRARCLHLSDGWPRRLSGGSGQGRPEPPLS